MRAKVLQKLVTMGLLACGIQVAAGTSRATTCASNWFEAPARGADDVPTNTLLWSYGHFGGESRARLLGPDGEVALEERFFTVAIAPGQGTNFPVLVPQAELKPNTLYQIESDYLDSLGRLNVDRVAFTTGDGPTTNTPLLPQLTGSEPGAGQGFLGLNRYLRLGVAHGGILIADSDGALGTVDSVADLWLPEDAGFDSLTIAADSPVVRWATTSNELYVGRGECLVWSENNDDRELARFGVLDLAGNFSGWSEPVELALPSAEEAESLIEAAAEAAANEQAANNRAEAAAAPHDTSNIDFQERNSGCTLGSAGSSGHQRGWSLVAVAAALAVVVRRRRV